MHQQQTAIENIVEKGKIARNKQFLLFPQCFLLNQMIVYPFVHIFDVISLFAAELEEPKIGLSGTGLIDTFQLLSAASLNLGQFQNGVLVGLNA